MASDDPNNKRTVILGQGGLLNAATKILGGSKDANPVPPGRSDGATKGVPPTRPIDGEGPHDPAGAPTLMHQPTNSPQRPDTMRGAPGGLTPGVPGQPPAAPARPATRVLMPGEMHFDPNGPASPAAAARPEGPTMPFTPTPGNQAGTAVKEIVPVVGWLVVVKGPGKGEFRPVFYGNNSIGRDPDQKIRLDFGDTAISSKEQAYIRYNPKDRSFTLIPNLSKTNFVTHNDDTPMGPAYLNPYDVIGMGITRLRFVPFCGALFEWSDPEPQ